MAFLDKTGLERLWLHILSKTNQTLASAKQYADDIKNDLLNGAGGAYDTLKELGDLIDENADAIDAIERLADTKSDKGHIHDDRYYTEAEVDDALKFVKEASGEVITVNDSAEQSLVGLKLYGKTTQATTTGKNLLDIASIVPPSATYNGITITSLGNGFTVKGTATGNAAFKWALTTPIPAGTYWLHAWNVGFNAACTLYFEKPGTVDVGHTPLSSNYRKQKIASDGDLVYLKLYIPSGQTVDMHLCPMLTVEETDTYEPYTGGIPAPNPNYPQELMNVGAGGSIWVKAQGKNLLPNTVSTTVNNGITFTSNTDGTIAANGTSMVDYDAYCIVGTATLVVGEKYLLTGCPSGGGFGIGLDGTAIYDWGNGIEFTAETANYTAVLIVSKNKTVSGIVFSPMIRLASDTNAAFEPYKDGGSLTVSTPNGLPGIKVSSGGNYTDTDGQQWLCDEIDLERGVRKPKVRKIVFDGSPDENWVGPGLLGNLPNLVAYHILDYVVGRPLVMCDRFQALVPNVSGQSDGTIGVGIEGVDSTHGGVFFGVRGIAETNEEWRAWLAAHPVTVIIKAPDDEPETPLSAAELAAYRAMTSQKPNTMVYNDAGASMTVEYADIKIDDIEKALNLPEIDSTLTLSNAAAEAKATGTALAGKVDKVAGKGLSTNDFTTAEKEKLSRLSETGNIEVDSELSDNSENPVQNKVINDALKFLKKSDGDIVTITDGAVHPAIELISHIEPLQEGSGDPSPDNVRPINGWDAVDITRTGKNLFGGDALADKLVSVINGIKDTAAETITFYAPNATGQKLLTGIFKPKTQYTFVFYGRNDATDSPLNLRIVYSDGTNTTPVFSERNKDEQIVIYSEYGKTIEDIRCVYWDGSTTLYYNKCGVFEGVVEAAQFEPYNGTTLTASLPETVYGGTLDWTTGVLTVTHKKGVITNASALYSTTDNLTGFYTNVPDMATEGRANGWCDVLPARFTPSGATNPCITFGAGYHDLFVVMPTTIVGTTIETINTYLAANPLTIVYPLATPYTIQLTPQQLFTLHGTNNVWSDCGETELTYATIRTDEIEKVLIDPTLSIKGTAAEAQTVGKELQHLQKETQFLDEAKGSSITINNSAELPLNNLKLYGKTKQFTTTGKNLLPNRLVSTTKDGITFTANDDGSITLNGTAGVDAMVRIYTYTNEIAGLDVVVTGGINSKVQMIITDNVHAELGVNEEGAGARFVGYDNAIVYINVLPGVTCNNVTVYPMIRISSNTDPAYEPYTGGIPSPNPDYPQELVSVGDDGSIGVKTMGKNLLPINSINTNQNDAGLIELTYLPAGTYTLSADITKYADDTATNTRMSCSIIYTDGQTEGFSTDFDVNKAENDGITRRKQRSFLIRADKKVQRIVIYALDYSVPGSGRNAKAENIQIEYGPTATAFEPYKDGGTLAISTPNGLPGIPVSSDGNYIDTTGQMWLCDEIDLARGVYIQRVGRILIDSTNTSLSLLNSGGLCQVYTSPSPYVPGYAVDPSPYMMCDTLPSVPRINAAEQSINGASLTGDHILLRVAGVTTIAGMREWLAANPTTVLYQPAQPIAIETPLSASEIASYRAMTTQNPTTVIYNDAAADMYVSYGTYKAGEMEEALGIPKVDKTLSLEGAPADAKTVGDILNSQYSVKRETGDIISVDTIEGLAIHPITYIEPIQSGSGEPSPDNVRPISGWNSVTAQRTGANLAYNAATSSHIGGLTFTVSDDGTITVDGTANETVFYHVGTFTLKPGSYRMSGTPLGGSASTYYLYFDTYFGARIIDNGEGVAFDAGEELTIALTIRINQGATVSKLIFRPGITHKDYEGSYEPYQGETLSATLPETVYGGTLDWATGVLTNRYTRIVFDGVTTGAKLDWTDPGAWTYAYILAANMPKALKWNTKAYANKIKSVGTSTVIAFGLPTELTGVTSTDDTATVVAKYNAVLKQWYDAGTPLEIVYEIATPEEIQLTPQQLSTIEGQNNIWSNAGKTEALINLTPINTLKNILSIIDSKLDKTTYEYNKELALGYSGKVCIGKFPAYDSNISVEIKSTTDIAYNGTLIIATQNINTTGGGLYSATVYGDANNILANSIKIHYGSGSNVFSVYIDLPSWSKNLLHIQCVSLAGTPTDIATIVSSIPAEATIVPVNALQATYSKATGLVNSINNNSYPAVRMISATEESDSYKMGSSAFAVGTGTKASGSSSHASGSGVVASGNCAHAEGYYSEAKGDYSHAEGFQAKATGQGGCHAEGNNTEATGWCTHAEGSSTKATTNYAHAEGNGSVASGYISHAEGNSSVASGYISHAEGNGCQAINDHSHAEGQYTIAIGSTSHAEGTRTIAGGTDQHVQGRYNIEDTTNTYAHIVGNGTGDIFRSNAHTLDWSGNAWFGGSIYVGGIGQTDTAAVMVLPAKLVSTETTPTTENTIYWLYE